MPNELCAQCMFVALITFTTIAVFTPHNFSQEDIPEHPNNPGDDLAWAWK